MTGRAAVVLCGGQSLRMGQPKAWLAFGPECLLQRVVRLIGSVVAEVVVVAARGQDLPDLPAAVRVVRDSRHAEGPLRGLATGLAAVAESVELVYAAATDAPFLQPAWWDALAGLIGEHDLIVPEADGRLHPLAAVYRRAPVLAGAERQLAAGQRRLTALVESGRGRVIAAHELRGVDPDLGTLRNLNTPADYGAALAELGRRD